MNARVQLGLLLGLSLMASRFAHAQDPNFAPAGPVDQTVYQLLPDRAPGPGRLNLREAFEGAWIRMEYFQGSVMRNDGARLGAPYRLTNGNVVENVSEQFTIPQVAFQGTLLEPLFQIPVEAPTTENTSWDDIAGARVTIGMPIAPRFSIEASAWGLEEAHDTVDVPTIPPTSVLGAFGFPKSQAIVIPLTTNGQPGDRVIVYDASFFSDFQVDAWNAEANLYYDLPNVNRYFNVKPLVGYRHTEYGEELRFGGSFDNSSGLLDIVPPALFVGPIVPAVSSSISSKTRNFRSEMQVGFRAELEHPRFTLGVEPKVSMGGNLIRSQVQTRNVRDPGDIGIAGAVSEIIDPGQVVVTRDREIDFSASADLGLYANFKLTEWFHLHFGYDLIWLGRVAVADQSIRYNEIAVTFPDPADPTMTITESVSDVRLESKLKDRVISAFSVGGEIYLW